MKSRKAVAETSPSQVQPKEKPLPLDQTPRDKSVVKRSLEPSFDNSEVCNKEMRAEEVQDLLDQLQSEDMEPFKGAMASFCEIINNLVKMGKRNAELNREVEAAKKELAAAKVVAGSAVKKAKEWENRAEKAEKAEKEMMRKNAELNRVVVAAKVVAEGALKKAKDSENRAEMADKAVEHWKKSYQSIWKKAEDSGKKAEKAENALKAVRVALINHNTSTI